MVVALLLVTGGIVLWYAFGRHAGRTENLPLQRTTRDSVML